MMMRYVWTFGSITGAVLAGSFAIGFVLGADMDDHTPLMGYLIMIVALSLIFVGVKRYRDRELGGVIRFGKAFLLGLGMGLVAALFYVIGWELYMAATNYSFMDAYVASEIAKRTAAGASAAEVAKFAAEMKQFAAQYANPLYRIPITFAEIAPVGLLAALVSAGILRNPKAFPAKA